MCAGVVSIASTMFKYMVFQQRHLPTMSYVIIPYVVGGQKVQKLSRDFLVSSSPKLKTGEYGHVFLEI